MNSHNPWEKKKISPENDIFKFNSYISPSLSVL